ncbi:MAG: imidazoleglycerol-phosphate dehydratase HisB [Oscillospiraceae bacterium]
MERIAEVSRITKETNITVKINLDAKPNAKIETGVGFFDHMLTAFAIHSGVSLEVFCKGDLEVDCHHTIEDTGIVLGQAFAKALGDKSGIARYGNSYIPMDEALGFAAIDISGRPFLVFDGEFKADKIGDMDTQMVEEFFRAFAFNAGVTLHVNMMYGKNDHHKAEAIFKAVAHAIKMAIKPLEDDGFLSTKGVL